MPYNNIISRTDAQALIPEQVSNAILTGITETSVVLALSRRLRMSTNQTRLPVLAALPTAYFVNGDTGLKQTTEMAWSNKYLNVEEIACIVPIPEAVLDDSTFDIWGEVVPAVSSKFAETLDKAILFGTNKPSTWPTAIVPAALAAGNTVNRGSAANIGGIAQDFNLVFGKVEADGFNVNGVVSRTSMKPYFRGARDTTGQMLIDVAQGTVLSERLVYALPGGWPAIATGAVDAIAGDWTQSILAVRQDLTMKPLDQAVIQGADGSIQYNLAQQDMVAMRFVARYAWQVANTINLEGANDSTQYPFATLLEA